MTPPMTPSTPPSTPPGPDRPTGPRFPGLLLLPLVVLPLLAGCGEAGDDHGDHDHDDHEWHRLTAWDGDREAFARFELHEGSGRIEGTLYLSVDHEPLAPPDDDGPRGTIRLGSDADGDAADLVLQSPGQADFELFFGETDEVPLHLEVALPDGDTWSVELGTVDRRGGAPHTPEAELHTYEMSSQWALPFGAGLAEQRALGPTVSGTGRVGADPRHTMTVSAPVEAQVAGDGGALPMTGARLEPGASLVGLSPTLSGEGSWVDARLAYQQARDAFQRGERLLESEAISRSEFQERERVYEARRAGYEQLLGVPSGSALRIDDRGDHLHLSTARTGVVTRLHVAPGMTVARGQPLLELHDPERLELELLVHAGDLAGLSGISALELRAGREGEWVVLEDGAFSIEGREGPTDGAGGRARLTVALQGGGGLLRVGQPVQVLLRGEGDEEAVVVPRSALFDEHSHQVVFVQHSGDQFERRIVEVGAMTGEWAVIESGLEAGERIVTRGVYPVHLATAGITIEDSHDH